MSFFKSINISATGLTAERLRMDIISKNIANANTTRTSSGTPYRRQIPIFKERKGSSFSEILNTVKSGYDLGNGVEVSKITYDNSPFKKVYNPGHPDADEKGYVLMPNVDIVTEMINLISASRGYEANVTALNSSKNIAMKALEIGR
ncbi:flagellar basal-body rod protein FlgC [Caminicella sporogenes DSM 14501]|uniref:Flagellar basal-body rod protein FlgC n=1 Tax=Caminicella sporogenes DSM 14501 TaxID=1121266 RepID=A0A1M6LD33_9FIRM|nr:flagellar basal body rod protein FlgC [Caminicella sporogenes]RKD27793.1 flagellar basal body rod protein FlgC [Caminicella sporogenes]WIF94630.1 flagellar basal body rod protein FlgC [Caminicella sporogenes]SHJ69086.1 flagellar basal-body rod protein FlgC [Caminicella sporogenes DSM 14501]